MKKTLLEYVQTNEKEYRVRIKTTFELDNDTLDRIERHLKKYDVIEVSKPERIMLQANPIDFPENHGWEIYVTDAVTRLPVSYDVLQEELVKLLCVHGSQLKVRNPEAPREEEAEQQDVEQKEEEYHVRLTDPKYSELQQDKKQYFGDAFNAEFLKGLQTKERKTVFAKKTEIKPSKPLKAEKSFSPISGRNTRPDRNQLGK
jgi:hypothetical protein